MESFCPLELGSQMIIHPIQMLAVGEFLEKHGASDGIMDTFKAICEALVEGQKPTTNKQSTPCTWKCACGQDVVGDYCRCGAYRCDL